MSDNPFIGGRGKGGGGDRIIPPSDPVERQRFWIERGNRVLWGQEPTVKDGVYLKPRRELEWRCQDGHYYIAEIGR